MKSIVRNSLLWLIAVVTIALSVVFITSYSAYAQNPNNFTILQFEADYYLSRNDQKASEMRVEEKIVAEFPQTDQNRGIERALPETYNDHSLRLVVESVVDESGEEVPYKTRSSNDNLVLRIGDPGEYVHGEQTYHITYTYENVTKNFENHDEFYWDTNGTQWQQPFQHLEARVHLDASLAALYDGQAMCFIGAQGSTEQCKVQQAVGSDGSTVLTFAAGRHLWAGENVSMVAGFQKGTFAAYQPSTAERVQEIALFAVFAWWGIAALVVVGAAVVLYRQNKQAAVNRPKGRGTIIPEYLPPRDESVLLSAQVAKSARHAVTAQIMDLAVRHYIKIYEIKSKKLFKSKSFELEIVKDPKSLREGERELFDIIFSQSQTIGTRVDLDDIAQKRHKEMQALGQNMKKRAEDKAYLYIDKKRQKQYRTIGIVALIVGALTVNIVFIVFSIVMFAMASHLQPTEKGAVLREYLEGLKMYMKLAEAERLKVLQGPDTAEKVNTDDKKQLIKLYERILPYAILFGVEKEWGKQFTQISNQAPDWYVGSSPTFNAVMFVGAVNSFTTATATTFSSPSDSSSSGLSGGGGFSGGGGGGGGGGGW